LSLGFTAGAPLLHLRSQTNPGSCERCQTT
jgi:hypothetical protein